MVLNLNILGIPRYELSTYQFRSYSRATLWYIEDMRKEIKRIDLREQSLKLGMTGNAWKGRNPYPPRSASSGSKSRGHQTSFVPSHFWLFVQARKFDLAGKMSASAVTYSHFTCSLGPLISLWQHLHAPQSIDPFSTVTGWFPDHSDHMWINQSRVSVSWYQNSTQHDLLCIN